MRRLRSLGMLGLVIALTAAAWFIFINHSPQQVSPLAWGFTVAGTLLTVIQLLRFPATEQEAKPSDYVIPQTLPPSPAVLGRESEVRELIDRITAGGATHRVVVVCGEPGVGKTALAIDVARRLGKKYPDGALFAWLGGSATAESVLRNFVTALQPKRVEPPNSLEALRELYVSLTKHQRQRLIVVLDDASDPDLVDTLLPASSHSAVIVTSRRMMKLPHAAHSLPLKPLKTADGVLLLAGLVGRRRVENEKRAAEEIAEGAHGSPLALQLAGASLAARPNWTLESTLGSVREQATPRPSTHPQAGSTLDLSFSLLTEQERQALLRLGLLDELTFEPWTLAVLMDLPQERLAWRICDRLVHHRLLEHVVDDATGVASYRVLDHVMEYVRTRMSSLDLSPTQVAELEARLNEHRLQRGRRDLATLLQDDVYPQLARGDLSAALHNVRGALSQARDNLKRAATAMGDVGYTDTGGLQIPEVYRFRQARDAEGLALAALAEVLAELGSLDQALEVAHAVRASGARAAAQPRALRCIGMVQRRQRHLHDARVSLDEALILTQAQPLKAEETKVRREFALLYAEDGDIDLGLSAISLALKADTEADGLQHNVPRLLWTKAAVLLAAHRLGHPGRAAEAKEVLKEAEKAAVNQNQRLWIAWIGYKRAQAYRYLGMYESARAVAVQAAEDFAAMRHRYGTALCRIEQASSYLDQKMVQEALPIMEDARQTLAFCEDRWTEAHAVVTLSHIYLVSDRITELACDDLESAINTFTELDDQAGLDAAQRLLAEARLVMASDQRPPSGLRSGLFMPGGFWSATLPNVGSR